MRFRDFKK